MASVKFEPKDISYKQVRMESIRPDVSKISSGGNNLTAIALGELSGAITKIDKQHKENEQFKLNTELKQINADVELYQAENKDMYFSKENRDAHEKVISDMIKVGREKIKNNKSLDGKNKEFMLESYNKDVENSYGYRSVKFLETYKEITANDSLATANRMFEENKATVITQDNVEAYNKNALDSQNLIYNTYEIKGDGKASRPVIEKNAIGMINADIENDLRNITAVEVTEFSQYQDMADNIQIRINENENEIKGRIDELFKGNAYKDLSEKEKKEYKEQLYTKFESESRKTLENSKMEALKNYNNSKIRFAEKEEEKRDKARVKYEKTAQKMYNLNDKGDLRNAYYEASGQRTDGATLLGLQPGMWDDELSLNERLKNGNNSFIPTIGDLEGLKTTVANAKENGETTLEIFENYVKPLLANKTKAEMEMIKREADVNGILKKSFIDVANRKDLSDIDKTGLLNNMSSIEVGMKLSKNMSLDSSALGDKILSKSMLGDILKSPTNSIRFVAMLKGRSFGTSAIDMEISNNIDFTSNSTVTKSAAKFFSNSNNKWILNEMKASLNSYKGNSYKRATFNNQSLDFILQNRLGGTANVKEEDVELENDIY